MSAKDIFERLAIQAMTSLSVMSSMRRKKPSKPGEWIEQLPANEREELQNLTAKDTEIPDRRLLYITGTYPENTTTVHNHSVKEDDES